MDKDWAYRRAANPDDPRITGFEVYTQTDRGEAIVASLHTRPQLSIVSEDSAALIAAAPDLLAACEVEAELIRVLLEVPEVKTALVRNDDLRRRIMRLSEQVYAAMSKARPA